MTPPATAVARRAATATASPRPSPSRRREQRPPLRVVEPSANRGRHSVHRLRRQRRQWRLAIALVTVSLLTVVVGHAVLAQGQVRLSAAQAALAAEETTHRQQELAVASLETPSRIVNQAGRQHMVRPSQVTQLPTVPLGTPLPAPKVTAAPTTTPTGTPAATAAATPAATPAPTTSPIPALPANPAGATAPTAGR